MSQIKNKLKNINLISDLNVQFKAYSINRVYRNTVNYYSNKVVKDTCDRLLAKRAGERLTRLGELNRPFNVFFLGTDEQQDRNGIIQTLEKLVDLICFTRSDGSYGQNYLGPPGVRRKTNTERLWEIFQKLHLKSQTPDIMFSQTWAGYIDPRVFSQIRKNFGTIIVNIAMDDRHQYWGEKVKGEWWGTYGLIPHIDLTLTAAPECVDWYLKEGCPAIFFPEASDPDMFHPMPELPKIHEVSFVGARYGIREKIVLALRNAGVKVTTYGTGWENGRLENKEISILFAQSKIVLGVGTIGHCKDFYALKMRDFDGPMAGSFYLTSANPDLCSLYEIGKEIMTYQNINDCVEKVLYFLKNEEKSENIALAGHHRARRDHTWEKRFKEVFSVLKP